VHSLIP